MWHCCFLQEWFKSKCPKNGRCFSRKSQQHNESYQDPVGMVKHHSRGTSVLEISPPQKLSTSSTLSICGRFPVYICIYVYIYYIFTVYIYIYIYVYIYMYTCRKRWLSTHHGDSPRLPLHFPQKCGPFDSPTVEKLSSARFFELDQFLLHRSQWNRPKLFGLGQLFLSLNHLRWLIIYPILIHAVVTGSLSKIGPFPFPIAMLDYQKDVSR